MRYHLCLVMLGSLIAAVPAGAQERPGQKTPSGEIQIPSGAQIDRMIDQTNAPPAKDGFSTNDATATRQMDRRAKRIDQDVMKGICTDC
ncbi:MAG: hypothetical protein ABWY78_11745 [Microvirga sp.]